MAKDIYSIVFESDNPLMKFYASHVGFFHSFRSSGSYHNSNPRPEGPTYIVGAVAIPGLALGVYLGALIGWDKGGVGGLLLFIPLGAVIGEIVGAVVGVAINIAALGGLWVAVITVLGLIFGLIGDGFSFLWGLGK